MKEIWYLKRRYDLDRNTYSNEPYHGIETIPNYSVLEWLQYMKTQRYPAQLPFSQMEHGLTDQEKIKSDLSVIQQKLGLIAKGKQPVKAKGKQPVEARGRQPVEAKGKQHVDTNASAAEGIQTAVSKQMEYVNGVFLPRFIMKIADDVIVLSYAIVKMILQGQNITTEVLTTHGYRTPLEHYNMLLAPIPYEYNKSEELALLCVFNLQSFRTKSTWQNVEICTYGTRGLNFIKKIVNKLCSWFSQKLSADVETTKWPNDRRVHHANG